MSVLDCHYSVICESSLAGSSSLGQILENIVRAVESVGSNVAFSTRSHTVFWEPREDGHPISPPTLDTSDEQVRKAIDSDELVLESAFVRMRCSLRSRRNQLVVFRRLPNEIMASIFDHLPLSGRVTASHVCSHWRALALNSPHLWDEINLNQKAQATIMLERSRTVQLFVHRYGTSDPFDGGFIAPHFHRIHALHLTLNTTEMTQVKSLLKSVSAPNLRQLTLNSLRDPDFFMLDDLDDPPFFFDGEVDLRRVSLYGVSLPWDAFCRGLTHLDISNTVSDISMDQFLDGLALCPNLRSIFLDRAGPTLPWGLTDYLKPERAVLLDHLERLKLTDIAAINVSYILSIIKAPPTLTLSLDVDLEEGEDLAFTFPHYPPQLPNILQVNKLIFEGHETDAGFTLLGFNGENHLLDLFCSDMTDSHISGIMHRSWCNIGSEWRVNTERITELEFSFIRSPYMEHPDFPTVVGQFVALQALTISSCDRVDGYLDGLNKRLCTRLTSLTLRDVDVSHDRLLMFVLSRRTDNSGGLKYLDLSDCHLIGSHTVRWLRDKVTVTWDR